jgi:hypothetical protein
MGLHCCTVPRGLVRYHHTGHFHFVTFSCYRRRQFFHSASGRGLFERSLERMRLRYDFAVAGYVVMNGGDRVRVDARAEKSCRRLNPCLRSETAKSAGALNSRPAGAKDGPPAGSARGAGYPAWGRVTNVRRSLTSVAVAFGGFGLVWVRDDSCRCPAGADDDSRGRGRCTMAG